MQLLLQGFQTGDFGMDAAGAAQGFLRLIAAVQAIQHICFSYVIIHKSKAEKFFYRRLYSLNEKLHNVSRKKRSYDGSLSCSDNSEFEKYERMMLNFGHTLGHSIEKIMNFKGISHGQAIAIGMSLITKNTEVKEVLDKILHKYNLKTETDITVKELIDAAKNDKKTVGDGINIVVVEEIGKADIKKITFEEFYKLYE